jgi:hypothetical protein
MPTPSSRARWPFFVRFALVLAACLRDGGRLWPSRSQRNPPLNTCVYTVLQRRKSFIYCSFGRGRTILDGAWSSGRTSLRIHKGRGFDTRRDGAQRSENSFVLFQLTHPFLFLSRESIHVYMYWDLVPSPRLGHPQSYDFLFLRPSHLTVVSSCCFILPHISCRPKAA